MTALLAGRLSRLPPASSASTNHFKRFKPAHCRTARLLRLRNSETPHAAPRGRSAEAGVFSAVKAADVAGIIALLSLTHVAFLVMNYVGSRALRLTQATTKSVVFVASSKTLPLSLSILGVLPVRLAHTRTNCDLTAIFVHIFGGVCFADPAREVRTRPVETGFPSNQQPRPQSRFTTDPTRSKTRCARPKLSPMHHDAYHHDHDIRRS